MHGSGYKGKVEKVSKARGTKKAPKGFDKKGVHPMTSGTGNKKMNRNLTGGANKTRTGKGKLSPQVYF